MLENSEQKEIIDVPYKKPSFLSRLRHSFVAVTLICVLVAAGVGFTGGYYLQNRSNPDSLANQPNENTTFIQTSDKISGVDGKTIAAIALENKESIVEIQTEVQGQIDFFGGTSSQQGAGSGVIVSDDGYIITNNHVVEGATTITVRLSNGESYNAVVQAVDTKTDLALLKIEAKDLKPVTFGNSDTLSVGELAVAIGNPLGVLGGTVTNGIISALDREITLGEETMNLLQTNAAINPGNSGGGLFNANGELIGIIVAKSTGSDVEGLGFAIPGNEVKEVIEQLKAYGYVKGRVDLGFDTLEIATSQQAMMYRVNEAGLYISELTVNSNAAKAGLNVGDLIKEVNGIAINSSTDFTSATKDLKVDDTLELTVKEGLKTKTVRFTLAEYIHSPN